MHYCLTPQIDGQNASTHGNASTMFGRIKRLFDHFIFADELPLDKRLFNLVAGFGLLASLAAVISRILEGAPPVNIAMTSLLLVAISSFLLVCNIYNKYRIGMWFTIIVCCNVIFPLIFFTSGGAGSGMAGYFVLSLVLIVMLMEGKACAIMLALNTMMILSVYFLDFLFPSLHSQPPPELMRHIDNVHGYLISGLFIGALIKFQTLIHIKEKRKAEAASEAKAAFLASVSHVIRTPLNAIMGLSELQLRKSAQNETQQNLEKIYSSGQTLLGIINDILDISSIESGKFQLAPEEYDVAAAINDTISLNVVRIGSKKINFSLEIDADMPARLYGDPLRTKQILNNILSNAFKYTESGEVIFKMECERDRQLAWLTFTVSDTGIGIREADMGRLFSDFSRFGPRTSTRQEGTGLGLSIAKNLAEMMGGTIMALSEYGKGSTFTVVLPQTIADETPLGADVAASLAARRFIGKKHEHDIDYLPMPQARVLIVDDVEINLVVAASLMEPYGLVIDCVDGGREAVRLVAEHQVHYDIIFMDHMMPDLDGMEAVRIIRNEINTEYAQNVPIVALTANALVGNEEMFLRNGFQAFLPKPIDSMRLDQILRAWVPAPGPETEASK